MSESLVVSRSFFIPGEAVAQSEARPTAHSTIPVGLLTIFSIPL
jgi:hypothetical protein